MEAVVILITIVLVMISFIGMVKGLDPRKWSDWFYVFCAFLSGMLVGWFKIDIYGGLMLGAVFAALVVYTGAVTSWQRRRYREKADSWLLRNENNTSVSPLARMIKKLMHK